MATFNEHKRELVDAMVTNMNILYSTLVKVAEKIGGTIDEESFRIGYDDHEGNPLYIVSLTTICGKKDLAITEWWEVCGDTNTIKVYFPYREGRCHPCYPDYLADDEGNLYRETCTRTIEKVNL